MEDTRSLFAQHLASIGFEYGSPREVIMGKLRQRMGEERFKELQVVLNRPRTATNQEQIYTQFQDIIEGNLLRSLDPGATLDASYHLYRSAMTRFCSGNRIIELGCWTGGLASFIASRHPNCTVVGVDGEQKIIDDCTAHYRLPNLSFKKWNYRWGKPEDLEPADVLLNSMGVVHHSPDNSQLPKTTGIRGSREYTIQRDHAIGYFALWRTAAKPDAVMFAVLRLVLFPRFLAWIDAAQATGWMPRLDRLAHVDMPGEGSVLPGLMFEARQSALLPEEEILDRWAWFSRRGDVYACIEKGAALSGYRALGGRTVLASREYRRQGVLTQDEVGMAGGTGYLFTQDAAAHFRLLIVSHSKAKDLVAVLTAGSQTPINDQGEFQKDPGTVAIKAPAPADDNPFSGGLSSFSWTAPVKFRTA